jgi:hypothetical protein
MAVPNARKDTVVMLNNTDCQEYLNGHVMADYRLIWMHAEEIRVPLFDFQPLIDDKKNFWKNGFATEVGTHISPAAYDKLAHQAKKVLRTLKKDGS